MATITSNTNGDWNAGGTWIGGVAPSDTDDVVIQDGDDVFVTADATCASLINGGAASVCSLTIYDGKILTVTGNMLCNGNSVVRANPNATATLRIGGTFTQSSGASSAFTGAIQANTTLIIEFIPPSSSGGPLIGALDGGIGQ